MRTRVPDTPSERPGKRTIMMMLEGGETCTARLIFVRSPRRKLPRTRVAARGGDVLRPHAKMPDRIDYQVPAQGPLLLSWEQ